MATTLLLRGSCAVTKNGVYFANMYADFAYDNDLRFFKVIASGNIWTSFNPDQIKDIGVVQVGTLMKKWRVSILAKWSNGDEYSFTFTVPTKQEAGLVEANINAIILHAQGLNAALRLLRSRERVSGSDIAALLRVDPNGRAVRDFVEGAISTGQVDGIYDGNQFVSKVTLQRETVRYDIVSKFEMNASGTLVVTCPKCGAAIPLETREQNTKCKYCGSPIVIPRKILDLM